MNLTEVPFDAAWVLDMAVSVEHKAHQVPHRRMLRVVRYVDEKLVPEDHLCHGLAREFEFDSESVLGKEEVQAFCRTRAARRPFLTSHVAKEILRSA